MVHQVNFIKEKFRKNKFYFLNLLFITIAWSAYFLLFSNFYKEAAFYTDKNANIILQVLFLTTYHLDEILLYLALAFVLLTIHQLIVLYFFIKEQKNLDVKNKNQLIIVGYLLLLVSCVIGLLYNLLWPLFLLVVIFSGTAVYTIHAITKYLYEDDQNMYLHNENIKMEGPFATEEEVQNFINEFNKYWESYFYKKGFEIHSKVELDDSNGYFVYLYAISKQN
ncbi:hypothetical protein IGL98_003269 [Enterococcus sp. DIV0840]|uniref:hypothetical protein n=1 Tax=Enterococcus TaxID=1350 RepID=UPI001A9098FB|nr:MULTISPECIES: hypothetical protein [Enterococcus]MBO0436036.1 hypothetical protein [Enterococcus sp. DIV0849a]MBO0475381.1 hypothetical protein [Enterococcus ureasiticus]